MRYPETALSIVLSICLAAGALSASPRMAIAEATEEPLAAVEVTDQAVPAEEGDSPIEELPSEEEALPTPHEEPAEVTGELHANALPEASSYPELVEDDLLDRYAEAMLDEALDAGEVVLSAQSRPSGTDADVYDYLRSCIAEVASGERTSTEFMVPLSVATGSDAPVWTAADLGLASLLTEDGSAISDEAVNALYDKLFSGYDLILRALAADCPYELYWFDKTAGVSYYATSLGARYQGSDLVLYIDEPLCVSFAVSSDYAAGTYAVDPSTGARVRGAVATARQVVADSAGLTPLERLDQFRAAICSRVSYDRAAARGGSSSRDPWQLINVFDGDSSTNVTCEGYAKAFKYLCDLAGIEGVECRLVTGTMTGGTGAGSHMWNVVRMPDGKNYLVDVTNCDAGTIGADDLLFIAPFSSGSVSGGYAFKLPGGTLRYSYDQDTLGLFETSELELSGVAYDSGDVPPQDIAGASVTVSSQTYTGQALMPTVTVTLGGTTLRAGEDYELSAWKNNTNVGTATVVVTGKGNYAGTASGTFAIKARSLSGATVLAIADHAYTGSPVTPVPVVKVASRTLAQGTDYTLSYRNNTEVGTATISITGKGNYAGSTSATFKIVQKTLDDAIVTPISAQRYTGKAIAPKPVVRIGDEVLAEGVDYTLAYRNNTAVGTATVTITGKGDYTGTKTVTFTISAVSLANATVSSIANQAYTGKALTPRPTVKLGSTTLRLNTDYTLSYKNNVKAGYATITLTGRGGYTGSKNVTFRIVAPSVSYRTHVQNVGWQGYVKDGVMSGTSGRSLRLEGINIKLSSMPISGGIEYRTHVQNIGWQSYVKDGAMSGTSGRSLRLEAIQIRLTGNMAKSYDVYYRVHCQNIGWMGWAKNGAQAGSAGFSYRLEGIQVVLVPKGAAAPGATYRGITQTTSQVFRQR